MLRDCVDHRSFKRALVALLNFVVQSPDENRIPSMIPWLLLLLRLRESAICLITTAGIPSLGGRLTKTVVLRRFVLLGFCHQAIDLAIHVGLLRDTLEMRATVITTAAEGRHDDLATTAIANVCWAVKISALELVVDTEGIWAPRRVFGFPSGECAAPKAAVPTRILIVLGAVLAPHLLPMLRASLRWAKALQRTPVFEQFTLAADMLATASHLRCR